MESTRRAQESYYLRLSEQAELEVGGPQQAAWLDCLEREHDNLRAALQGSLEQTGDDEAEQSIGDGREIALRLGAALRLFWRGRGQRREGRTFLERALAAGGSLADTRIDPSVR